MFSGIVEATGHAIEKSSSDHVVRIRVARPGEFSDLHHGDSVAVNGICLTVEDFGPHFIQFAMGFETLRVLGKALDQWLAKPLNLERSIRLGDRIHGHLVSGHVDDIARIVESTALGENWILKIEISNQSRALTRFLWVKGSIAIAGVSLTVNTIESSPDGVYVSVCLIPETIKRTNLTHFKTGESLPVEFDYLAKSLLAQSQFFPGDRRDT